MEDINKNRITILMADDDPDDQLLVKKAFKKNRILNRLHFVNDGEELMDYLFNHGKYENTSDYPHPGIILLDLKMPKKNGIEALKEIKADPNLKSIPIVILTTSKEDEDIIKSYNLGVNSYITKPVSLEGMINTVKCINNYWLEIVELPGLHK